MTELSKDPVVIKLDSARTALAEAKTMQEVKRITDMAAAAEIYARRQQLGQEAIDFAHAIRIEALRRLGEMLQATERATGGQPYQRSDKQEKSTPSEKVGVATLSDLDLDYKTSSLAQKLADLPQKQFEAVREGALTITKAIREVEHARRPKIVLAETDTYRVVYADPPWKYGDSGLQQYGHASYHYPSMSIQELCALPIKGMAAENAVLFLWVTSPMLEESFEVINAWGFMYKASFVWDKMKHNFGHYNSVRHEFLLVCTRGKCTPDSKTLHDSVQAIERSATHSAKPDAFRTIIDALCPHGARIELFSRSAHPGWKTWGNEVSPEACEPVQTGCTTKENIQ